MSLVRPRAIAAIFTVAAGLVAAGSPSAATPETPASARKSGKQVVTRLPAPCDGKVLVIGTEVGPGERVPPENRVEMAMACLVIQVKDGESVKLEDAVDEPGTGRWRRWREGEPVEPGRINLGSVKRLFKRSGVGGVVKAGQTVALIDPTAALADLSGKIASLEADEAERLSSAKSQEDAERRVAAMEEAMRKNPASVSKDDYDGAKLTAERYRAEEAAGRAAVVRDQQRVIQANNLLQMHEVRARTSGMITAVAKPAGTAVKALETVLVMGDVPAPVPPQPTRDLHLAWSPMVDGILLAAATEVAKTAPLSADQSVTIGTGEAARRYRLVRVGDTVEAGQLLGLLDNRLARREVSLNEAEIRASAAGLLAAEKFKEEAQRNVRIMEEAAKRAPGSVDRVEQIRAAQKLRAAEALSLQCKSEITMYRTKLDLSKLLLKGYEIRSPVRGVVRELFKQPGEALRGGQPLLSISASPSP